MHGPKQGGTITVCLGFSGGSVFSGGGSGVGVGVGEGLGVGVGPGKQTSPPKGSGVQLCASESAG